jgi:hypothetical protein
MYTVKLQHVMGGFGFHRELFDGGNSASSRCSHRNIEFSCWSESFHSCDFAMITKLKKDYGSSGIVTVSDSFC